MDNQFNPQQSNQWQQQPGWQNQQPGYQGQNGQWQPNPNNPNPYYGTIGFGDAIRICFTKYADFKGRAPRAEYWWWVLFTFIASMATNWIPFMGNIVALALLIPGLAVSWRRLHDIGKSGAWYFLPVVPALLLAGIGGFIFADALISNHSTFFSGIGVTSWILLGAFGLLTLACEIVYLVWMASDGEPRPNRFGPNPYGIDDNTARWQ